MLLHCILFGFWDGNKIWYDDWIQTYKQAKMARQVMNMYHRGIWTMVCNATSSREATNAYNCREDCKISSPSTQNDHWDHVDLGRYHKYNEALLMPTCHTHKPNSVNANDSFMCRSWHHCSQRFPCRFLFNSQLGLLIFKNYWPSFQFLNQIVQYYEGNMQNCASVILRSSFETWCTVIWATNQPGNDL